MKEGRHQYGSSACFLIIDVNQGADVGLAFLSEDSLSIMQSLDAEFDEIKPACDLLKAIADHTGYEVKKHSLDTQELPEEVRHDWNWDDISQYLSTIWELPSPEESDPLKDPEPTGSFEPK